MKVQAEYGRYDPSKAKFSCKTLIAHKYLEGTVQSTSKEEPKGRETAVGEPVLSLISVVVLLVLRVACRPCLGEIWRYPRPTCIPPLRAQDRAGLGSTRAGGLEQVLVVRLPFALNKPGHQTDCVEMSAWPTRPRASHPLSGSRNVWRVCRFEYGFPFPFRDRVNS